MALPDTPVPAVDDTSPVSWHTLTASDAARQLGVDRATGLSDAEAASRLAVHGPNRLTETPRKPAWKRFAGQLAQPLVLVLIAAGLITSLLGEWVDASVIFGVVLVNAIIGYWQEAKAEGALAALARSVATPVTVRRDSHRKKLDAGELVPGDVVLLAAGDRVPADLRLFHQRELHADESTLTGESLPVGKDTEPLPGDTLLAERRNMAYAGTTIVAGQGAGLVIATGDATETGRIAGLIASAPELATPLTRKMATFSNWLLWAIGGLAVLTFGVGLARGEAAFDMFMAAVALAVGAIPEGLPAAVTITLAIGVARMAKRRAIIRQLPAVETLGSTTVICSDKTGTLTENAMTVRALYCGRPPPDGGRPRLQPGRRNPPRRNAGCHRRGAARMPGGRLAVQRRQPGASTAITGRSPATRPRPHCWSSRARADSTSTPCTRCFPATTNCPFDAGRQYMATLHASDGEQIVYVKGALERLLPRCSDAAVAAGQAGSHRPRRNRGRRRDAGRAGHARPAAGAAHSCPKFAG